MKKVHLKRKIAPRIANGHPWIFANEVDRTEGNPAPADVVEVFLLMENLPVRDTTILSRRYRYACSQPTAKWK